MFRQHRGRGFGADVYKEDLTGHSTTPPSLRFRVLRAAAVLSFLFYLGWNLYWLAQGRLPPAIFYALTGYPSPTTGGTRAMIRLAQGQWRESLQFNAMAIPLVLVLSLSLCSLGRNWFRFGKFTIAPRIVKALFACLLIAWVLKLMGDRAYW